jgi:hypothetical protein
MLRFSRLVGVTYLLICLAALLGTVFIGPLGYAPLPLPFARTPEPVVVTVWYDAEKRAWFEDAARRFEATSPSVGNRPVRIVLRTVALRDQAARVARQDWRNDGAPTVVSPTSSMVLETLHAEWAAFNGGGSIIAAGPLAPAPLALTPLVAVAWQERGELIWGAQPGDFWQQLHDALAQPNWSALGGREEWGPVKLGQTAPPISNSGTQALLLMAYGFRGTSAGLTTADVQSPEFTAWLKTIQGAVPQFGDSTADLMTTMVQRGPGTYDVALVHENLAIESLGQPRTWGALRVYYPPATLVSDHPYAILDAPWTSAREREGARQFRDFLLSRASQERAVSYGLRPADASVPLLAAGTQSPFERYTSSGLRRELPPQAEQPAPEVVAALLDVWERHQPGGAQRAPHHGNTWRSPTPKGRPAGYAAAGEGWLRRW